MIQGFYTKFQANSRFKERSQNKLQAFQGFHFKEWWEPWFNGITSECNHYIHYHLLKESSLWRWNWLPISCIVHTVIYKFYHYLTCFMTFHCIYHISGHTRFINNKGLKPNHSYNPTRQTCCFINDNKVAALCKSINVSRTFQLF